MLYPNILEVIGHTPMVRLNKVTEGLSCEIYAKCEFLNPGGSSKDRIGFSMVKAAQAAGQIKPGDTLIEPTSGNTGIGIALAGAVLGYSVIITMPSKMSQEKQVVLERLGAKIYRTPTEVASQHPDSHISLAKRLQQHIPNAFILDQYANPQNPEAHSHGTAEEIITDMGDDTLDMAVISVGTGGTITGLARRLKQRYPAIQIVGVDPVGSLLGGGELGPYLVEGIGYDFIPEVLDNQLVDTYMKTQDAESFHMARRLIREEGLLVGGSAGAAVCGALKAVKQQSNVQRCVVILPDSIRNYLSKFASDEWMRVQGFL